MHRDCARGEKWKREMARNEEVLYPGIAFLFNTYGCMRPVSGIDHRFIGEWKQLLTDGGNKSLATSAGEVASADPSREEGIACEEDSIYKKADATGGVAWGVNDLQLSAAEGDLVSIVKDDIGGRAQVLGIADQGAEILAWILQGVRVRLVNQNGNVELSLEGNVTGNMIDMPVGNDYPLHGKGSLSYIRKNVDDLTTRIDDKSFSRPLIRDDIAVGVEGADDKSSESESFRHYHFSPLIYLRPRSTISAS